jgi:glucokinase
MRILASDVGGTHIRLALVEEREGELFVEKSEVLDSAAYATLEDGLAVYLKKHRFEYDVASFSIAGPIVDGAAKFTNRPWTIRRDTLAKFLGKGTVYLLNDLEAQAYGLGDLQREELETIHAGKPEAEGAWALVAPGTGLGQAMVSRAGGNYLVMKSEGGHADFGATSKLTWALQCYLEEELEHVSWEAVLSGPGLHRLYEFLRAHTGKEELAEVVEAMHKGPAPKAITHYGMSKQSELARAACELFVELLATFAGNLALSGFATGGVYIGGGVVQGLLPLLKQPVFIKTFARKGRMKGLLESVPIAVVRTDRLGILGAALLKTKQENKVFSILGRGK